MFYLKHIYFSVKLKRRLENLAHNCINHCHHVDKGLSSPLKNCPLLKDSFIGKYEKNMSKVFSFKIKVFFFFISWMVSHIGCLP